MDLIKCTDHQSVHLISTHVEIRVLWFVDDLRITFRLQYCYLRNWSFGSLQNFWKILLSFRLLRWNLFFSWKLSYLLFLNWLSYLLFLNWLFSDHVIQIVIDLNNHRFTFLNLKLNFRILNLNNLRLLSRLIQSQRWVLPTPMPPSFKFINNFLLLVPPPLILHLYGGLHLIHLLLRLLCVIV